MNNMYRSQIANCLVCMNLFFIDNINLCANEYVDKGILGPIQVKLYKHASYSIAKAVC